MEVFGKIRFCFLFSKRILHCSVERKKFLILIWFDSRKCKIPLINRRTFEDVFFVCFRDYIIIALLDLKYFDFNRRQKSATERGYEILMQTKVLAMTNRCNRL